MASVERSRDTARLEKLKGNHEAAKAALERAKKIDSEYSNRDRKQTMNRRWTEAGKTSTTEPAISNERIIEGLKEQGVDPNDIAYVSGRPKKLGSRNYYHQGGKDRTGYQNEAYTGKSTLHRSSEYTAEALRDQSARSGVVRELLKSYDSFIRHAALGRNVIRQFIKDGEEIMSLQQAERVQQAAAHDGVHLEIVRVIRGSDMERFGEVLEKQAGGPEIKAQTPHYKGESSIEDQIIHQITGLHPRHGGIELAKEQWGKNISNRKGFTQEQKSAVHEALANDAGLKNCRLVPAEELHTFLRHAEVGGSRLPIIGAAFRRAVLPLSTRWIAGNMVEAALRTSAVGLIPVFDQLAGRGAIDARFMDALHAYAPNLAAEFENQAGGGLLYAAQSRAMTRTRKGLAAESGDYGPVVKAIYKGTRGVVNGITDEIFGINSAAEHSFKKSVRGKAFQKEIHEFTGSWIRSVRAQDEAIEAIIRHWDSDPKYAQAKAAQFGRYVDQTLGKYSKFSPELRNFIQGYAPFLAWYLNCLKFVMWTLPAHHPVLTGLMAAAHSNLDSDIKSWIAGKGPGGPIGGSRFGIDTAADKPTGFMKALLSLPGFQIPQGAVIDLAHLTPFGAYTEGLGRTLAKEMVPQIMGPIATLSNLNPITLRPMQKSDGGGKPIKFNGIQMYGANGQPQKTPTTAKNFNGWELALMALNNLIEGFVPGVSMARRIREGGKASAPNSNLIFPKTNPNSTDKGLSKTFSFLPATKFKGKKTQKVVNGIKLYNADGTPVQE
jgi:hypothetical protein